MIDHVGIRVADVAASRSFYERALAPLGYETVTEFDDGVALGRGGRAELMIVGGAEPHAAVHIAFQCAAREIVDAFYDAALQAGGRDNGRPGVREQHHPDYYAAYVFDPDGNNIEAVCHTPTVSADVSAPTSA